MEEGTWLQVLSLFLTLYVAYTVYRNHQTQLKELETGHTKILADLDTIKENTKKSP